MKKILTVIAVSIFLLSAASCTSFLPLQGSINTMETVIVQAADISQKFSVGEVEKDSTDAVEEPLVEKMSEVFFVTHEADGSSYIVLHAWDSVDISISYPSLGDHTLYVNALPKNHDIQLLDSEANRLQSFMPDEFGHMHLEDVNVDGYMDIVVNTGGTWNETKDLYIWDVPTESYVKVIYEGFDMLSFYSVHDGYIENFLRGSDPDDSIKMKLIWDGNVLVKEFEY